MIEGNVLKYGSNIDTDAIIPARYLNTSDENELAAHCMEDLDVDFSTKAKKGDILVVEDNFGCGSSREHAPICIKAFGISCIIAKSFARIFYRNAINIGLPILECPEAVNDIQTGDKVSVDIKTGTITNLTKNNVYKAQPFPEFMTELIQRGGLINYVREKVL